MKKVAFIILFVLMLLPLSVFSDSGELGFTHGDWEVSGNRLYQNDVDTGIAKAWLAYPQNGVVEYRFNVRLEEGFADDAHAGFGIHLFVDKPARGFSWGEGNSYLLWLNYDADPVSSEIPKGLSAQVYRSEVNWDMELLQSVDLSAVEKSLASYSSDILVPVRIVADGRTGNVRLYDPVDDSVYYNLSLGNKRPLNGNFVTLRTNSASFSFGY